MRVIYIAFLLIFFHLICSVKTSHSLRRRTTQDHSIDKGARPLTYRWYELPGDPLWNISATRNMKQYCPCSKDSPCSMAHIHIPKTAGSELEREFGLSKTHNLYRDFLKNPNIWKLDTGASIRPNLVVTVLRNPYDRLMSWFRFCINGFTEKNALPSPNVICQTARDYFNDAVHGYKKYSVGDESFLKTKLQGAFSGFLRNVTSSLENYEKNPETSATRDADLFIHRDGLKRDWLDGFFIRNQYEYITDSDKQVGVDFIIRHEHFSDDVENVISCADRKRVSEEEHFNNSDMNEGGYETPLHKLLSAREWHHLYNLESLLWCEHFYEGDFEYFGFLKASHVAFEVFPGSVIRVSGEELYYIDGDKAHKIPSEEEGTRLGYDMKSVQDMPRERFDSLPIDKDVESML